MSDSYNPDWDVWDEIDSCIEELDWFVSRKKDLSATVEGDTNGKIWAKVMAGDLSDLRAAVAAAKRASVRERVIEECAKVCEGEKRLWMAGKAAHSISDFDACAKAIRALNRSELGASGSPAK